ncbi:MAG: aminopeptidase [Tractidigestivibacter sp.]|jgi:aspartyl aminopeptidase|uniref:aminopeptidase n=1 Tax=Tractidigestivibacter sp. TaxID=2847320 RepID=UPI003D8E557D
MERPCAWERYNDVQLAQLDSLTGDYRQFISDNKTEREFCASSIELAKKAGYQDLNELISAGSQLKPGDKVYVSNRGKALLLACIGTSPLTDGVNILGAHIDSPRLDVKQNPLEVKNELATLDTHYYGGIKKYQWVTMPLAMHGVVAKKDGSVVPVRIGEAEDDPVFVVSDLLIHLARKQLDKKGSDVIEGELLDVIVGNRPLVMKGEKKDGDDPVRAGVLKILSERLGIEEEDFLSAELEIVPAGRARDLGLDRSMILGYGHDDRSCAYPSLRAQLDCQTPQRTAVTLLVDKEEIGSVGATGMHSRFFEDTMAEILELAGEKGDLALRRCLRRSRMLSSDVSAAYDPSYADAFDPKNAAYLGHGLAFNKFTGSNGKAGSNDADAEYVALIRRCMDDAGVAFQTCELGRVDAGGGGTIAYILANYGMQVIDCGVPVLSMHSPWEVVSKADVYEAYRGYQAFLALA